MTARPISDTASRSLPLIKLPSLRFLLRNAGLILGIGAFVAFWIGLYAWTVYTPQYAAKSTVIIKDSAITSRYIEPQQNYALQTTSSNSSNPVLNTMALLKSERIGDALWDYMLRYRLGELKDKRIKSKKEWDRFFQDGSAFVKAKNQPGTDLITIQFSWRNPVIAKEGLNVIVKAFQDSSREMNKQEEIGRTRFLVRQVGELEERLKEIRHQKSAYRMGARTVSMNREQDELAASRMEMMNRLSSLEAVAQGKETQVRNQQALLGMSSEQALEASAFGQNGSMTRLQDELYRLRQYHSLLSASLTQNNPKVQEVRAQIAQVTANIEAERLRTLPKARYGRLENGIVADSTRNRIVESMLQAQNEARDLRAQAAVIRTRLEQINQEIRKYPSLAEDLANIEQHEASMSTALDQLRQKVLEGRIKEEQTLSNVFVVDSARIPEKSQFPSPFQLTVIGMVLGLGAGVSVAFLWETVILSNVDRDGNHGISPPSSWLDSMDEEETAFEEALASALPSPADSSLPPSPSERAVSLPPVVPIGGVAADHPDERNVANQSLYEALSSMFPASDSASPRKVSLSFATRPPRPSLRMAPRSDKAVQPNAETRVESSPSEDPVVMRDSIVKESIFTPPVAPLPIPGPRVQIQMPPEGSLFRAAALPISRLDYEWPSGIPTLHSTFSDAEPDSDTLLSAPPEWVAAEEQIGDSLMAAEPVRPKRRFSLPAFLMKGASSPSVEEASTPSVSKSGSLRRAMQTLTTRPLVLQP